MQLSYKVKRLYHSSHLAAGQLDRKGWQIHSELSFWDHISFSLNSESVETCNMERKKYIEITGIPISLWESTIS